MISSNMVVGEKSNFLNEFLISANVPAIGLGDGLHEASYVYKDDF